MLIYFAFNIIAELVGFIFFHIFSPFATTFTNPKLKTHRQRQMIHVLRRPQTRVASDPVLHARNRRSLELRHAGTPPPLAVERLLPEEVLLVLGRPSRRPARHACRRRRRFILVTLDYLHKTSANSFFQLQHVSS